MRFINCLWLGETDGLTNEVQALAKHWLIIADSVCAPENTNFIPLRLREEFNIECYWERKDQILEMIIKWVKDNGPIDRIVAPTEFTVELAGWLRSKLKIPGPSFMEVSILRDKALQKQKIVKVGIPTAAYFLPKEKLPEGFDKIKSFVLKPRKQAGSRGVQILKNFKALEEGIKSLKNPDEYIVEEFIPYPIIHIDGLVREGKVVEAIGSRYFDTCLEWLTERKPMGSVVVNDHKDAQRIFDFANLVTLALGITDSAFHLEAFESNTGELFYLEIAGRPGGAAIVPSLKYSVDLDLLHEKILADMGLPNVYQGRRDPLPSFGWIVAPMPSDETFRVLGCRGVSPLPPEIKWSMLAEVGRVYNLNYDEGLPSGKFVACIEDDKSSAKVASVLLSIASQLRLDFVELPIVLLDGVKPIHQVLLQKWKNVHLIVRPVNFVEDDYKRGYKSVHVLPDNIAIEEWIEYIKQLFPQGIARVISFHDDDQYRALRLSRAFDVPYQYEEEVIENTKNKALMRRVLAQSNVDTITYQEVKSLDDFNSAIKGFDLPCILKPVFGVASKNIYRLDSTAAISDFLNSHAECLKNEPYLLESFIVGEEFSIECFSVEGAHSCLGITKKLLFADSYVESGHVFPADIDIKMKSQIETFVFRSLDALKLRNGPSHTEVKVSVVGQIHMIETHTRWGGDNITRLIQRTFGFDPFELSVCHALGRINICHDILQTAKNQKVSKYTAVNFIAPPVELINKSVLATLSPQPINDNVELKILKTKPTIFTGVHSSFDRWAFAIGQGDSPDKAIEVCQSALSHVQWQESNKTE